MALVGELELGSFDYTDPGLTGERFHTAMRELAAEGWLAAGPYGYVVLDREAGEFFLRTRSAIFPGMKIAELFDVKEGPLWEEMKRNILHVNGADHTRLRSLVNPALTARAVERWRGAMRGFLEELFVAVADAGRCEFVGAFAKPYPSQTIATVMGAPLADAPRLHHWSNWIQRQFDAASMMNEREGIERAVEEFYEYARALLAARREDPGDDLISTLLAATYRPPVGEALEGVGDRSSGNDSTVGQGGGRIAEKLSEEECVNLVLNVLIGGVDTTQSQLAHAVRLLAEHPAQWEALVADPSLAGAAVEEALRFEPITPFTARITTEELTYRDVSFPKDTIVMVCAFTGNRDLPGGGGEGLDGAREGYQGAGGVGGSAWAPGADTFDITVERPKARALTFGAGVHYCLGANLARLELEEGLGFLARKMPRLELDGEPVFESILGIYGLAELPIRFG
ncbi:MAG TPA: cytochrome P450 [Solirubrobacteraceae bacterium]|jgi:cytochrome P450|nr:cytochrome P450 [Solirubrobacteraceae bacterium]